MRTKILVVLTFSLLAACSKGGSEVSPVKSASETSVSTKQIQSTEQSSSKLEETTPFPH